MNEDKIREILKSLDNVPPSNYEFFLIYDFLQRNNTRPTTRLVSTKFVIEKLLPARFVSYLKSSPRVRTILGK